MQAGEELGGRGNIASIFTSLRRLHRGPGRDLFPRPRLGVGIAGLRERSLWLSCSSPGREEAILLGSDLPSSLRVCKPKLDSCVAQTGAETVFTAVH